MKQKGNDYKITAVKYYLNIIKNHLLENATPKNIKNNILKIFP